MDGLGGDTPVAAILKVSQRRGRELRNLGVRRIAGRDARGVEILLDDSNPAEAIEGRTLTTEDRPSEGALWRNERVEVWLDPESGLPIEFKSVRSGEGYEATTHYTDLEWDLDFPPETFDPTTPGEYEELPESPLSD